ncbi:MAG: Atxe2 family lasso peptide isopeptidase [Pseudomonadota bacterium]
MVRWILRLRGGLLAAVLAVPGQAYATCDDLVPGPAPVSRPVRAVTPLDLVRLRDIGPPDASVPATTSPLAVSPDGRSIAFVLSRADPAANIYCRALVVLDLRPGAVPRIVDRGGELQTDTGTYRGLLVRGGYPSLLVPAWSPDGQMLAYLRRDRGVTQMWRAAADGSGAVPLTQRAADVTRFAWSVDGTALLVAVRGPAVDIAAEARTGFLYDDRFMPNVAAVPQPKAGGGDRVFTIEVATGVARPASGPEAAWFEQSPALPLSAKTVGGLRAWVEPVPDAPLAPPLLRVVTAGGTRIACDAASCRGGAVGLWPVGAGGFLFLRREGWARGEHALYAWRPGSDPRRILLTHDWIEGCIPANALLVCTRETARTPREIVLLDPVSGRVTPLYDPNPDFASLRLGKVVPLTWKNDRGLEARGDLVLPPDYRPGTRLPLIVTQYQSDGFLRGATGDEYPIFAFAARGFAVLSVDKSPIVATLEPGIRTYEEANAADYRNWAERRSQLSSIEAGIALAIARGAVDPDRIAITGLSDGATTAAWALVNSRRFAAAALSTCCLDATTTMVTGGIAYADRMRRQGFPAFSQDGRDVWRPLALSLNAGGRKMPILMQLADDEYLFALPAFTALRENHWPVEMYVFPDEHHIKWQPAHRLAIYQRNLDWFDFWFNGREDSDPGKAAQYIRWRALHMASRR